MLGLETLSNPAVKSRLDHSVDFLKVVTDHLLAAKSASQALHWPGRTIRLADGTCISKPGSKAPIGVCMASTISGPAASRTWN